MRGRSSVLLLVTAFLYTSLHLPRVHGITKAEKQEYRDKVVEMFFHAYNSYMDYAYPADELMPLSCKGRVRGVDRSRGSVDEALGGFSLTLIDSLDTLAVIGAVDEFSRAIQLVLRDVRYDNDFVVSVFETNIRILGGLLGAHFAAQALREKGHPQLSWYSDQLLEKAEEVGQRLLPAFNTTTGLPYPKINLQKGMAYGSVDKTTCTACAGTNLLEFAALSRVTGNPVYELRARKAMEAIWERRHEGHDLVGTTIDVLNGEWTRKDSGVGAGIDSYYEYCLKSYILLGDTEYLHRFSKHYNAIKKYISNGPLLVDVSMSSPNKMVRSFMDALLAFWPGLQVLWGDVGAAMHTHDMLYHVTERYNFLPEAFTLDFRVHWASHPLRPEFIESTYFLHKATCDPYYLDVGKTVVENLNQHARVPCGYAGLKDVKKNTHEDRMDSFVLAETFKYLYLLFAEEEDLVLDMDDFIFSTEAHLFPLSLAKSGNPSFFKPLATNTSSEDADPKIKTDSKKSNPVKSVSNESVVMTIYLTCPKDNLSFIEKDHYEKIMLHQSTSSRFGIRPPPKKKLPPEGTYLPPKPRLTVDSLDFTNKQHLSILNDMGIVVHPIAGGKVQISHVMQKARNQEEAEEGWYLMQDIMRIMDTQKDDTKREAKMVKVLTPDIDDDEFIVGPALFGPDLGKNQFQVAARAVATDSNGCTPFPEGETFNNNIAVISRGNCLFVKKVRNAQAAGAAGVIITDHLDYDASSNITDHPPLSMSGDGSIDDIHIPAVFMHKEDAHILVDLLRKVVEEEEEEVFVLLTWVHDEEEEEEGEGKGGGGGGGGESFKKEKRDLDSRTCSSGDRGCRSNSKEESQNSLFDDGFDAWNGGSLEPEWDTDSTQDIQSERQTSTDKTNH